MPELQDIPPLLQHPPFLLHSDILYHPLNLPDSGVPVVSLPRLEDATGGADAKMDADTLAAVGVLRLEEPRREANTGGNPGTEGAVGCPRKAC